MVKFLRQDPCGYENRLGFEAGTRTGKLIANPALGYCDLLHFRKIDG